MTTYPPVLPTPTPDQRDDPRGPGPAALPQTAQRRMQRLVPAHPRSALHTMPPTSPRPASGDVGSDRVSRSRHDGYDAVEVEDGEGGAAEEIPSVNARPPLPRLNSQSRAPSSPAPLPETSTQRPPPRRVSSTGTYQQQQQEMDGPYHLQSSREIPIRMGKSPMRQSQRGPKTPTPSSAAAAAAAAAAETAHNRTDEGTQGTNKQSSAETPQSKSKDSSTQGKNAPIRIPKVTPIASGLTIPPNLAHLAQGLEGKYVDEFGNILDWNGQVLGRVEGDLPSMIGRPVSMTGEVFSEDGEVVGYVVENDTVPPAPPSPKPIAGMGDGLKVDHMGNILDKNSNVIGHFDGDHLAKSVQHTNQIGRSGQQSNGERSGNGNTQNCSCGRPKPSSTPSPSEVFLDVKSTNDGIQLIIKIPTVFNGGGNPNIHLGTG